MKPSWFNKNKSLLVKVFVYIKVTPRKLNNKINSSINIIKQRIQILGSQYWQYYYRLNNWVFSWFYVKRVFIFTVVLLILLFCSFWFYQDLRCILEPYFSNKESIDSLKTLFVSLGGALIGATAIAFSLIMFAMQVNVERMPHGLFRKFSSDLKLLSSFGVTFALAMVIIILSLIPDDSWVTISLLVAAWCVNLMVIFLLVAYRRALSLISPSEQLAILVNDTKRNLKKWNKAALRASPLLKGKDEDNDVRNSGHDIERNTYFHLYPQWSDEALRGVAHCFSFARRYSEQGDHDVSALALNAVLSINFAYIKVKGKTFFSNNYLVDNPMATDNFINDTLERLRQNVQIGVSRGDEQQIEQSFRALLGLCQTYSNIDYATEYAVKSHAHLAAGYLSSAVESLAPHNMPDVLMEGLRLMGSAAQIILSNNEPDHITSLSEKISLISCMGSVNEKYRPVTQVGVAQLASLTFELLRCESHNIKYAIKEVRDDIKLIAKMYLKVPDAQVMSMHSASLAPYYSGMSATSFQNNLPLLVNAVSDAEQEDENAKKVIQHIEQWADGLYQDEKELLLLAIEKRSFLAFDIIHTIKNVTGILCALSNASACDEHMQDKLRRHALWLVSVLTWIPDEQEVVSFVENHQLTEILFETAVDAHQRGCNELATSINEILLSWAFKAGKYRTGWAILERACYGLACLNIIMEVNDDVLLRSIQERVDQVNAPSLELRFRASKHIKEKADEYHNDYALRAIEAAMAQVDHGRLRTLLFGIAEKLVPEELEREEQQEE